MGAPQLPIDVNEQTGEWSTDGLPMLYVPQHFFVNNHKAVEQALGIEQYQAILREAGYKSAYYWCEQEASTHGLEGVDVFEHYLKRLSQRGWGMFSFESIDAKAGIASIRLDHSAFVKQYGTETGRRVCYMFAGWFVGAMEWVKQNVGEAAEVTCEESRCACEGEQQYCLFDVRPK